MNITTSIRAFLAGLFILALNACSGPPDSPEARVEGFIHAAEEAAETRSLDFFKASIAESYMDDHGLSKKELLRMLAGYFFRNQSIHVVSKITDLSIADDGYAEVVIFAALAGSPEVGFEQLAQLRGDTYRIELSLLLSDDDIQIVRASWERSTPAEAFNQ
jgi:hypothetical protein